jgi:hypothetical protein
MLFVRQVRGAAQHLFQIGAGGVGIELLTHRDVHLPLHVRFKQGVEFWFQVVAVCCHVVFLSQNSIFPKANSFRTSLSNA